MHLSTVKIFIDFGIDWPRSSVLFLISNQLFFSKLSVPYSFAFFCIYLVRPSPHMFHTPHGSAHILIPMHADRVPSWTVKQSTFISWWDHWSSTSLDSAVGTGFYKLLSLFAILYTLRMLKFYVLTLINHRNNGKTTPISLYFVRLSSLLHQRLLCVVNTYVIMGYPYVPHPN